MINNKIWCGTSNTLAATRLQIFVRGGGALFFFLFSSFCFSLCVLFISSHASSLPQALAANPAWEQQHRCRRSAKAFCPWRRRRRAHRLTICFRLKVRPSHTSRTNCSSSTSGAEKTTRPGKGSLKLQNRLLYYSTTLLLYYSTTLLLYYSNTLLPGLL